MLADIERRREDAVIEYAKKLDGWEGSVVLSEEKKARVLAGVPQGVRDDIDFAHARVTGFARAQRESLREFEVESGSGIRLGQRVIPVGSVGCYVPGGRYAYVASALMSVATAKTAGVRHVLACSPPRDGSIHPAILYAMDRAGADRILELGGVQAMATMVYGLFDGPAVDMLVGPGNAYVNEAKRILFGQVGIDVLGGPTESAVIADETADPMTVAIDLLSQAEHGYDSPVWLFTTSPEVGDAVLRLIPLVAGDLPNSEIALTAWRDYGAIVVCDSREEAVEVSDRYAPEHLQVHARDLPWWTAALGSYGSLFLGEGSTAPHGDKCSGTNHILPTGRAARYTGGLSALTFLKVVTFQEVTPEANRMLGPIASRLCRLEGMEAHARACDWRLRRFHPDEAERHGAFDQTHYT
ncbi:MAG: histidinol dehydrogenase [Gemmatimonadetes bacterium]|nr:histidinol dehydrogenase [Gemmatimonadota bacterium]